MSPLALWTQQQLKPVTNGSLTERSNTSYRCTGIDGQCDPEYFLWNAHDIHNQSSIHANLNILFIFNFFPKLDDGSSWSWSMIVHHCHKCNHTTRKIFVDTFLLTFFFETKLDGLDFTVSGGCSTVLCILSTHTY